MATRYEDMKPCEKAAVDAVRARHRTPEARERDRQTREAVMEEYPPIQPRQEVLQLVARLKAQRERLNLSLADVAARSGLDRAYLCRLENGGIANPTLSTLARYAGAVNKRLALGIEDLDAVEG